MVTVLSLIANPAASAFSPETLLGFARELPGAELRKLAVALAYDLYADGEQDEILQCALRARQDLPIDVNLVDAQWRRKKLLIADMDSTIIEQECIDEIADYAGKRAEISAITERAMRGELDFEGALKERVAMLKGVSESVLLDAFETKISLTPGAKALVATMNKAGAMTALVSGGFTFFTSRIAEACGFQFHQANELIIKNGVLTGEVAEPILGRAAKEEALMRLAREGGIDLADTLAVGDGANDLAMVGRAGLGVAFRAKPAVAVKADARIDHGDLTALLYLQGYSADEIVESG